MPGRDWKLRIEDILESIAKIQRYTEGITFEVFAADEMRVDAVIRNIIIIGEAARHIPDEVQERYPEVPSIVGNVAQGYPGARVVKKHGSFYEIEGYSLEGIRKSFDKCWQIG